MMRGLTKFLSLHLLGLCAVTVGCAGRTPNPETPSSNDEAAVSNQPAAADASEPMSSGQSLDVGMEFKDKDENRRASHDAPPTASWKPLEKDKAADPKKPGSVTAAR